MRRLLVLLFLLPLEAFAQGAGTPPYRGVNNWNLIFGTDNVFDIGATSSQRPRTGYFGTSVVTPALTVSGLTSGRALYTGASGLLSVDAGLTYDGTTLESIDQTNISGPDATTNVEIGSAANDANAGTGGTSTVIGNGASNASNGADNTIIGSQAAVATATATRATAVGKSARVGGASIRSIAVGSNANADASFTVVVGESAVAQAQQAIVLGYLANSGTNQNVFVAGSGSAAMSTVYFGEGITDTTATDYTISGTGGSGSNNAGAGVILSGGPGTGTAQGGYAAIATTPDAASSSTPQTRQIREYYLAKAKALTEGAATSVLRIAVPAEEGASGEFRYQVYATDGSTPQTRSGRVIYNVSADGATETCVLGTPEELDNTPTGTLTATITCDTTPTQAVDIQINATSSLTQTVLEASASLSLNTSAAGFTVAPQ